MRLLWVFLHDGNRFTSNVFHSVMLTVELNRGEEVSFLVTVRVDLLDERQPHSFRR